MGAIIQSVIYVNAIPCLSLLMFLAILSFNPVFDRRQTRLFCISALVSLGMIIIISIDFILSESPHSGIYLIRRFTSFCNFALSPVIPLLLFHISGLHRPRWYIHLPLLLNTLLCGISIFNGIVFHIRPNNGYDRGPLFFVPFAISLFYMFMLILQPRRHVKGKQMERSYLLAAALLLLLGMFMEIVFKFRFLTWDFTMPALILYYLLLNIQSAILDSLTGAYNRRMYDKQLAIIDGHKSCTVAMLDINGFKAVNDSQGHDVGDRYLITLTEVLSKSFAATGMVFRIGGDEFVVISTKQNMKQFADAMGTARRAAGEHGIRFACGMLAYEPTQPISQAMLDVDQLMYEDKNSTDKVKLQHT